MRNVSFIAKIIIASLREVPKRFLILMIFMRPYFYKFFKLAYTARIYFLLPETMALIKSLTLN